MMLSRPESLEEKGGVLWVILYILYRLCAEYENLGIAEKVRWKDSRSERSENGETIEAVFPVFPTLL